MENAPIEIRVYEQVLSDGSKVYGVTVGGEQATLDCATEREAYELAEIIHRYSLNTKLAAFAAA